MIPAGVLGTDISHHKDNATTLQRIDFERMAAAGAKFSIFKATQGEFFVDGVFKADYNRGLTPRGGFHYLDWSCKGYKQAGNFLRNIENVKLNFPPVIDFECLTTGYWRPDSPWISALPTRAEANAELWSWLSIVENQTKRIPMIYTRDSYWKEFGSTDPKWKRFPLWIASYRTDAPVIPAPWTDCVLWQFTDRGNGHDFGVEALAIDLDVFRGTESELRNFCGMEAVPPPADLSDHARIERLEQAVTAHGIVLPGERT